MININEIKTPFLNDKHKIAKSQIIMPLPGKGSKITVKYDEWYDQFGIKYQLKNKTLIITNITELSSLLDHINKISSDIDILFSINNCSEFNNLCKALNEKATNKNIVISINKTTYFNKTQWLDFELLPDNVKVTNLFSYYSYKEELPGDNSFDWWGLWLSDKDYECVKSKLTLQAKERFIKLHNIALNFYNTFLKNSNTHISDIEKAEVAYKWLAQNTVYDSSATNQDGTLKRGARYSQDPIVTYETKKGVCAGRARLMKVLLNNKYTKVNCFLTGGTWTKLQHEWNEIYTEDGNRLYYDLSFNICSCDDIEALNKGHHNLDHNDFEKTGTKNIKFLPSLPKRKILLPNRTRREDNI